MFFLSLNIFQQSVELARADRKCCISTLPEKTAIARMKRFDPFRRGFLYLLDHLSLRNGSRQRCDNVNMICHSVDVHELGTEVSADCRQISMHARPHATASPLAAITEQAHTHNVVPAQSVERIFARRIAYALQRRQHASGEHVDIALPDR